MNSKKYPIFLLVHNRYGVLTRVAGLFANRGYNIDNLSVGCTDDESISRMTIVVDCNESLLEQILQQLRKLIDVIAAELADPLNSVTRELMLVKIMHSPDNGGQLLEAINIFRGRVVDMAPESMIVEITGQEDKLNAFIKYVEKFGIIELSRTGITVLDRGQISLISKSEKEST
ncbi:MAG: acetolactate synthase small subunit [Christensenellaceae bacterium]|jgi:acetolactate synthase-1/3 small subunit|nr:acetolactate synthase small subunit [Christensenellaceae bacterium]